MRATALIALLAGAAVRAASAASAAPVVNDVTGLNPVAVEQIVTPHGVADVVAAVATADSE
jgi:hypothetical protein